MNPHKPSHLFTVWSRSLPLVWYRRQRGPLLCLRPKFVPSSTVPSPKVKVDEQASKRTAVKHHPSSSPNQPRTPPFASLTLCFTLPLQVEREEERKGGGRREPRATETLQSRRFYVSRQTTYYTVRDWLGDIGGSTRSETEAFQS
jgi:hypothetical protein